VSDPGSWTLIEAADAIAAKKVSSVELTKAAIARAKAWQPKINAFIALDEEGALAAAARADATPGKGKLHGVPLAHKDMYYRKGRIATCGSAIRRDWKAETTATALTRLDAAGAIDLGTLNMAEFAFGPTGHNYHHGHCRNPWNPAHMTGGSSSGSGAAVAARLVYGALGSDTGGSIRMPSFCNGLVGIKPTWGRVSRAGAMPLSWSMDTVGPLTRSVADAARILGLIAGADPDDATTSVAPVEDYEAACGKPVAGLRIGLPQGYFDANINGQVAAAIESAAKIFEKLGVALVKVQMPDLDAINAAGTMITAAEAASAHRPWLIEMPEKYSDQVRARLYPGLAIPAVAYLDALRNRAAAIPGFIADVFGQCDALLCPVSDRTVPTIAETDVGGGPAMAPLLAALTRLCRPFNVLGLPSLSVPCGFDKAGLPLGFQLAGRPFAEATLFALGQAYEKETQWSRMAPQP
jgi:aspartyl-tRNA(Asn)/glutamyl-tRNA(Gln) amidotransferase subunit A